MLPGKGSFPLLAAQRTSPIDVCLRCSGFPSATTRPDIFRQYSRDTPAERPGREAPKMAATTLVSPAAAYHSNPPGPPPYSHSRPPIPAMMAGPESRRSPIDSDASKRQSLPSLSEVFSGAKSGPYSPATSASGSAGQGLVQQPAPPPPPPSFAASGPSRIDPGPEARNTATDDRHFRYPRSEPPQGPPGAVFAYGEHREMSKPPEPPQRNGHHYAAAAPPPPPMSTYAQQGQLPSSQYPLPQGPISPRHMGPPGAYDRQRLLHSDEDYGSQRRFETSTLNRHLDAWGYSDSLHMVSVGCPLPFPRERCPRTRAPVPTYSSSSRLLTANHPSADLELLVNYPKFRRSLLQARVRGARPAPDSRAASNPGRD